MSGEYGLKKDRDRKYFLGAVPVVGLRLHRRADAVRRVPGQGVVLRRGRHRRVPEGHVLAVPQPVDDGADGPPAADELDGLQARPGRPGVGVRQRRRTVELFLNGRSLGVRRFDRKTTDRRAAVPGDDRVHGDDKNVTGGPCPGSYTSPNGSSGKLHLTWHVPFEPGKLVAVARQGGREVARDEVDTAGRAGHGEAHARQARDRRRRQVAGLRDRRRRRPRGVDGPERRQRRSRSRSAGGHARRARQRPARRAPRTTSRRRAARSTARRSRSCSPTARPGPITVTVTAPGLLPATTTVFETGRGRTASPAWSRSSCARRSARRPRCRGACARCSPTARSGCCGSTWERRRPAGVRARTRCVAGWPDPGDGRARP